MAAYLDKLAVRIMIGVGAAFDMHSGRVRQAPYWMQRSGLEWFFRLTQEPRRLWKRYLINNPLFVARILAQFTGIKRYSELNRIAAKLLRFSHLRNLWNPRFSTEWHGRPARI